MSVSQRPLRKKRPFNGEPMDGFDVTCVIGRVEFHDTGDMTPHEAAFRLIGQHQAEGTFIFPGPGGEQVEVTVKHTFDPTTPQHV